MERPGGSGRRVPAIHKPDGQASARRFQANPPGHSGSRERPYAGKSTPRPPAGEVLPALIRQAKGWPGVKGDAPREGTALATRLKAAVGSRPGETVEAQE